MTAPAPNPWSAKGPVLAGFLTLLVLIGGFGSWSVLATIAGAIIAPGQIAVERNRQIVQHPDGGVVRQVLVAEGATVAEGQTLIRLDGTALRSQIDILEDQHFEILARLSRLEAERDEATDITYRPQLLASAATDPVVRDLMDGQERLFRVRRTALDQEVIQLGKRLAQIENQVAGMEAQAQSLSTQLELVEEELADQEQLLSRGLAQASRVSGLKRDKARLAGQMGEVIAAKAETAGRITEIEIEELKLRTRAREDAITKLRDLAARELELAEKLASLRESHQRLDIKAPVSGIVYGLTVFAEKSVVKPAQPLMFLVPQDRPLVISSRIQTTNIDEVRVGQEVELMLSAFDARTTPQLKGRVLRVSPDAFADDDQSESYYKVEITFQEGQLARLSPGQILVPGMPVEAFFRTNDRSPLAYLVKPLAGYFTKAFRES